MCLLQRMPANGAAHAKNPVLVPSKAGILVTATGDGGLTIATLKATIGIPNIRRHIITATDNNVKRGTPALTG